MLNRDLVLCCTGVHSVRHDHIRASLSMAMLTSAIVPSRMTTTLSASVRQDNVPMNASAVTLTHPENRLRLLFTFRKLRTQRDPQGHPADLHSQG